MIQRVRNFSFCTVVMKCSESAECREVELTLTNLGFQSRAIERREEACVCNFAQEHADGHPEQLRDALAFKVRHATEGRVAQWRAFVQVCGSGGAWASLAPGRPTVHGVVEDDS